MALTKHFVTGLVLNSLIQCIYSAEISDERLDALLARIDSLEASDAANKAKIVSLEASDAANKAEIAKMESEFERKLSMNELKITDLELNMDEVKLNFKLKEIELLAHIGELKTIVGESNGKHIWQQHVGNDDTETRPSEPSIKPRGINYKKYRDVPENEVAFYATHTDHDVHHLGIHQVLEFPIAITNIGNAYNYNTGAFVAPVDGTYVIHATVLGIDTPHHMQVHFDVSGTAYATFYVAPLDQSSQMLVIELTAGKTVTLRNDVKDDGFIGQHYTTFSGFLLYQHYPSGNIIGK